MPTESLEVIHLLPARPERIYNAWLDGEEHGRFTGGAATVEAKVGGTFTAWDGYIEGKNLLLEPHRRIVQSWRSTDFPANAPDSRLEILLAETPEGTQLTLRHSEIPEGQGPSYEQGWAEHYFEPMTHYFSSTASRMEGAGEALEEAAEQARAALETAGAKAKQAVKAVKKTARTAGTRIKALTKQARRALGKKSAPKKAAPKKAAAKKPAPKKSAAKKAPKKPAPKKSAPRKPAPKKSPKKAAGKSKKGSRSRR